MLSFFLIIITALIKRCNMIHFEIIQNINSINTNGLLSFLKSPSLRFIFAIQVRDSRGCMQEFIDFSGAT